MIYKKTVLGKSALNDRSGELTRHQRTAFIMFDGNRITEDVLVVTAGLGVTIDDVNYLVTLGLLEPIGLELISGPTALPITPATAQEAANVAGPSAQPHYLKAYPIATRLTAGLGLRGFMLNLAVEAAGDLVKLRELAPKIKEAIGPEKFKELNSALYD